MEEDRGDQSAVACSGLEEEERAKLDGKRRLRVYCARASERFFALSQKSVIVKVDFLLSLSFSTYTHRREDP